MNVLRFLTPKIEVEYVNIDSTVRQGLEKMRAHSYTAIPVITSDGKYAGTVSEGDFLYYIVDLREGEVKNQKKYHISDILRKSFNPAVKIEGDKIYGPGVTDCKGGVVAAVLAMDAPTVEVKIITAFLKLTVLPLLSVSLPSSSTCNNKLNTSGCAFSISSKRTTLYGLVRTLSVSCPPFSS